MKKRSVLIGIFLLGIIINTTVGICAATHIPDKITDCDSN